MSMLSKTDHTTHCPWKGDAAYYTINLDSKSWNKVSEDDIDAATETEFKNAAWYYPTPSDKAKNIKDHVAFCEYRLYLLNEFNNLLTFGRQECRDGYNRVAEICKWACCARWRSFRRVELRTIWFCIDFVLSLNVLLVATVSKHNDDPKQTDPKAWINWRDEVQRTSPRSWHCPL